jgi:hypothetical protein
MSAIHTGGATTANNPSYLDWSRFKAGSSETLGGDMLVQLEGMPAEKIHYEWTFTLREIGAEQADVTLRIAGTEDGKTGFSGNGPDQTLPANVDNPEDYCVQTGFANVSALGHTFVCRVYSGTGGFGGSCGGDAPFTIYISDEVPGGIVKYVGNGPGGNPMTLIVTGFTMK